MSDFLKEYEAHCAKFGTPERIELLLCDLNAVLRGKWLPGEDAEKLVKGGVRLPMSTYAPNILGAEVEETGLGAGVLNEPALGIAWLADRLAQYNQSIKAGEIVLSGSFIRPIEAPPGSTIEADFGNHGVVHCRFE